MGRFGRNSDRYGSQKLTSSLHQSWLGLSRCCVCCAPLVLCLCLLASVTRCVSPYKVFTSLGFANCVMATLLCYGIKPSLMDLELSGMHCDNALLTSLLDPPLQASPVVFFASAALQCSMLIRWLCICAAYDVIMSCLCPCCICPV